MRIAKELVVLDLHIKFGNKKQQLKVSKRGSSAAVRSSQVAHKPVLATPTVTAHNNHVVKPTYKLR